MSAAAAGRPEAPLVDFGIRWKSDTGTPADKFLDVAQPKLPHLFWFDNRQSVAEIVDLRIGGSLATDDCQLLEGDGGTEVKIGYRAYHPDARFQLYTT